jgi:hypothetical protein
MVAVELRDTGRICGDNPTIERRELRASISTTFTYSADDPRIKGRALQHATERLMDFIYGDFRMEIQQLLQCLYERDAEEAIACADRLMEMTR